jgi:hypothetical protein
VRLPSRWIEGIEAGVKMVAVVSIPTRLRVVKEIQLGLGVDDHQAIGFGTVEKSRDKDSRPVPAAFSRAR